MKGLCGILLFQFWAGAAVNAQIVNEEAYPDLPYPVISACVLPAPGDFYVSGLMSSSSSSFDGSEGFTIPFFLLHPESPQRAVVLIPDTARFLFHAFQYDQDELSVASAVSTDDSLFVAWSKMGRFAADVPPTYFDRPVLSAGKFSNGKFESVFSFPNGLHPSVALDNAKTLHCVWENVTPLSLTGYGLVINYQSTILYLSRSQTGLCTDTVVVGTGFFPQLIYSHNTLHCIYFEADSLNQPDVRLVYRKLSNGQFDDPVVLYEIPSAQYFPTAYTSSEFPMNRFAWGPDSLGGIHVGWASVYGPGKAYMLHYRGASGIQIDSTPGFYSILPKFKFMPDGETRVVASTLDAYSDTARLRYFVSKQGTAIQEEQVFRLASNSSSIVSLITDSLQNQDALVTDYYSAIESCLIKNIGNSDTATAYLANGYNFESSFYVDRIGRVWSTATRGSTGVIVNFLLSDVGKAPDFSFPLAIGDRWYYSWTNYENPIPPYPGGFDSTIADKDTLFLNGNRYVRLHSTFFPDEFLRKDGFRVYQYSFRDSAEVLRFDLSAQKGDTIAFYRNSPFDFSVLQASGNGSYFGLQRRYQDYQAFLPGALLSSTTVVDSIGIVGEADGLGNATTITAALIDGKRYGTVVAVHRSMEAIPLRFSLSQNYPNPFNPATEFRFTVPDARFVSLKVFDLLGREVSTLVSEKRQAGTYTVQWNGGDCASGVYFYQLRAGDLVDTKKMLLVK